MRELCLIQSSESMNSQEHIPFTRDVIKIQKKNKVTPYKNNKMFLKACAHLFGTPIQFKFEIQKQTKKTRALFTFKNKKV